MRMSEMTAEVTKSYIRADEGDVQDEILNMVMESARSYITDYTGLSDEEIDSYEDLALAYVVLVQDMYDNRTMHPDTKYANSANKTVETILDMHRRNLL